MEATAKVAIEETGFLGKRGQDRMLIQHFMQPTGSGSGRADYEERRHA